ncbi:sigma-70 family RNA polymerase sigma factor [Streptococcus sp. S784/96/1]|uniref:sigma-70 family RNA polymerase sigma factor n=1 Tax=Streptococcus sp. S784/96/1 TaxID=2653499 RepID=UPI00138665D9|nr:sigma-70 family RNA polymerase sigma factor [Streptococcus sp. S784/96/1]
MEATINFESVYGKVRPIVLKLMQVYFIKMWEREDWHQEGMITLYQLLAKEPELVLNTRKMCVYFKTKFSNRVKDELRKQESVKRGFDRMAYDEIGEVAHSVSGDGLDVCELVAYREAIKELCKELSDEEKEYLRYLMSGECFKGRRAFQRKIKAKLGRLGWGSDYRWLKGY